MSMPPSGLCWSCSARTCTWVHPAAAPNLGSALHPSAQLGALCVIQVAVCALRGPMCNRTFRGCCSVRTV